MQKTPGLAGMRRSTLKWSGCTGTSMTHSMDHLASTPFDTQLSHSVMKVTQIHMVLFTRMKL